MSTPTTGAGSPAPATPSPPGLTLGEKVLVAFAALGFGVVLIRLDGSGDIVLWGTLLGGAGAGFLLALLSR